MMCHVETSGGDSSTNHQNENERKQFWFTYDDKRETDIFHNTCRLRRHHRWERRNFQNSKGGVKNFYKKREKTSFFQLESLWNIFSLRLIFGIIWKNLTTKEMILVFYPTNEGVKNFSIFCVQSWIIHDLSSLKIRGQFCHIKNNETTFLLWSFKLEFQHLLTFSRGGWIQNPMRDQIWKN